MQINITAKEIKNICSQYEFNEECKLKDTDETYIIKKAMSKLDKSDFIIYCLYMELETKTSVAEVLGISRISMTRILKQIENKIKENIENDTDRPISN